MTHQVIPAGEETHYSEQIVRLPGCYQINSRRPDMAPVAPTRAEAGLPDNGFVFCCFNNNYKITPEVFAVWAGLLRLLPGSVLWLLQDNQDAATRLRAHVAAEGLDPSRLVFAPRCPLPQHLARHALADLFLDTLPCNAHTTASDALWAGLPLLTCTGHGFAGRVATSLLRTMGLDELVTPDLAAYAKQALELAQSPERLAALHKRVQQARDTGPLFDTTRSRQHLEAAYQQMVERQRNGLPPAGFDLNTC